WILNIIVGIAGFLISFYLEFIIFASITGHPVFSFCLTAVLETSKILTIIFHRMIDDKQDYVIPDMVVWLNTFFKFGLVFLSLVCSIAMISKGLDRPNLDSVKAKDKTIVTDSFRERTAMIQEQREKRLGVITSEIKEKYQKRYAELDSQFLPKIKQKEALRDAEFSNQVGGVRKGPFWNEYNRQLQVLTVDYKTEKSGLRNAENAELERNITKIESEFQAKLDSSLHDKEVALTGISKGDYKADERAKNETIAAFLATINAGLGLVVSYLTFAMIFSFLTSILLESTIYLTFNYVTMFYSNILNPSENEFVVVNQAASPQEQEVYEEPRAQPDIDPSVAEFYQNLQDQFRPSESAKPDFVNP
ncbi:hypothetical protein KAR91_82330, partial [Candidatus Pacearchaeota archaeon]|nr:hypothetical protein [Candidatus Pacearchaeota archaeon]